MPARYGDPFTISYILGPVVITGSPAGAKDILGAPENTFDGFGMQSVGAILGETSLMLAGGEAHRRMRRLHGPAFRPQRVRGFDTHILTSIDRVTSFWPTGKSFSALEACRTISLDVIVRAVFGTTDEAQTAHMRELLREMVDSVSPWLLFLPSLQQSALGFGPWARHRRAASALEQYIRHESARRRDNPGEDVLTQLLLAKDEQGQTMSATELRDQLVTLLLAGYDTSGFASAWALYYVHKFPAIHARLRDEIGARSIAHDTDAIMQLPYLDAVVNETLRLQPLAGEILRTAVRPFELRGYEVPVGTGVAISAILLHEDPDIYPEPTRFCARAFSWPPFCGT